VVYGRPTYTLVSVSIIDGLPQVRVCSVVNLADNDVWHFAHLVTSSRTRMVWLLRTSGMAWI
jgi:hypothetical protein